MRVLFVSPYVGDTYGGTSKVVLELAQGLATQGLDLDIVTTQANGIDKLKTPLNCWIQQQDYRIRYLPSWHSNDMIISPALVTWLYYNVTDYDIVHTHTIFSPLLSAVHWVCQHYQKPYIMTPHGMLEPWAMAYKANKKKLFFRLLEKSALQKASSIQALTTVEAKHIQSLGIKSSIAIVPNGIHQQVFVTQPDPLQFYFKFPETRGKTLILFLGRIDPKKGLDLLAAAFGQVKRNYPNIHLVIAGPDSIGYLRVTKRFFEEAGCLNDVTFTGMLTGEMKHAALAAANLYVAPYYSEGFSMSILEGMASALPSIITTGCNFPEADAAHVACVVNLDANEIASALIWYLANPQLASAMGHQARQFIFEHYTWDKVASKLIKVYKAIIRKEPFPDFSLIEVA